MYFKLLQVFSEPHIDECDAWECAIKDCYWRTNRKIYICVPAEVAFDSALPLTEEKGYVKVIIDRDKNRLIIEKSK